ncbi:hypothetical protein [Paenibacillus sp. NPDC058071]|uniref:hypothetical protein n=1 Tax=Paenibacillus sp. NPDC058071 TaxID=3346326 RepID=UPI0036D793F7
MKNPKKFFVVTVTIALLLASTAIVLANENSISLPWIHKADSETDKLREDKSLGIGEWKRKSLEISGELPKDAKRLTVESAVKIISEKKNVEDVIVEFNKIAGAPDFEGGSGLHRAIYYLDEQREEAIYVLAGKVMHVTFGKDGSETIKPLAEDISSKTSPTAEPK